MSESDLKTVVASITRSLELKMGADLDAFEAKFKRDMDTRISVVSVHDHVARRVVLRNVRCCSSS